MKNLLIMLVLMVCLISCKKEFITNNYPADAGSKQEVSVRPGETTNVTDAQIEANYWTHTGEFAIQASDVYVWKYESGTMAVIIEDVPRDLFWNPNFKVGTTITGKELLLIKNRKK